MKTIRLEASDEQLFSKGNMLLPAASELTYHTVNCSALNAEELNREQGFIVSINTIYILNCNYVYCILNFKIY